MRTRPLMLACAAFMVVPALPGSADVKQVKLGVKGVTCPTCSYALRKAFKKLDNVSEVKLETRPASIQLRPKPGQWLDLAGLHKLIKQTGFEAVPEQTRVVATGTLAKTETGLVLTLDGMKTPTTLAVELATAQGAESCGEEYAGRKVEVDGHWVAAKAGSGGSLTGAKVRVAP